MDLASTVYALLAGLLFGLAVHVQRLGLTDTDDLVGSFISVATMASVFWIGAATQIDAAWWSTRAALLFAICGLVWPAMGQRLQIASVVHAGPAITSAVGSFTSLFAILPAMVILDEQLDAQAAVGIVLLIAGLVLASQALDNRRRLSSFVILLLPLGAAFARGIAQPVAKFGLFEIPSPYFATLVMTSVSTFVLGAIVLARGRTGDVLVASKGRAWFIVNGLVIGAGILSLQQALNIGEVSVVSPLISTTPLWTIAFGAIVFRNEILTWRHAAVAALVFVGSVLIVMD